MKCFYSLQTRAGLWPGFGAPAQPQTLQAGWASPDMPCYWLGPPATLWGGAAASAVLPSPVMTVFKLRMGFL